MNTYERLCELLTIKDGEIEVLIKERAHAEWTAEFRQNQIEELNESIVRLKTELAQAREHKYEAETGRKVE
jgi:hypothetical protein